MRRAEASTSSSGEISPFLSRATASMADMRQSSSLVRRLPFLRATNFYATEHAACAPRIPAACGEPRRQGGAAAGDHAAAQSCCTAVPVPSRKGLPWMAAREMRCSATVSRLLRLSGPRWCRLTLLPATSLRPHSGQSPRSVIRPPWGVSVEVLCCGPQWTFRLIFDGDQSPGVL